MNEIRIGELSDNLSELNRRIEIACQLVGRAPTELTVIAVTKTWPVSDIEILTQLGIRDFAENRLEEMEAKQSALSAHDLTWHFVGQVQSNKASRIARAADVLHSVDREKLVPLLSKASLELGRELKCLIQVALETEHRAERGGVAPSEVAALADSIASTPGLVLQGVMAVAPLNEDPAPAFSRLKGVASHLRAKYPDACWISAGMSDDLEAAIAYGATHLRIGGALLGNRPPVR